MSENQVVIYSNGIADFQRTFCVSAGSPTQISIPVRQDHLADVLASFNVYGQVRLDSPPTFRPSNDLEGNLSINPHEVLKDLATSLSGARVELDRAGETVCGTLVGLHQEAEATDGASVQRKSVIVLADDGLRQCALREIRSFRFLDRDVQAEIDKALQRNYQRIRPNSTFVELTLSTQEADAQAIVQYTIPAAAWKISYRLHVKDSAATELHGFAIVDNNTDEDWSDIYVCVVTGEPITFSTDLSESKTPGRRHVNLVSDMALGAVEVEAAVVMAGGGVMAAAGGGEDRGTGSVKRLRQRASGGQTRSVPDSAEVAAAEVHEVGDFSLFRSERPVTIPAQRSTVIPVFQLQLAETKPVLHYRFEQHPERPWRCVELTNEAEFSLNRGVCTVFEEAAYVGSCLIPALKPSESRLLPHALETGVAVRRDQKRQRNTTVALKLSDGVCHTGIRQRRETQYHVKNGRDLMWRFVLDHTNTLSDSEVTACVVEETSDTPLEGPEPLTGAIRYSLSVAPHAELTVKIVEQRVQQTQVELISLSGSHENLQVAWLEKNLVRTNGPLADDPDVQKCLQLQQELDASREAISEAVQETERLAERQQRLRQNIKSGGQDEVTSRWRAELDEAEQAIRKIEEERLPDLRNSDKELRSQLREALLSLSAEWSGKQT